jgi:dCMP deaminase
MRLERYWTVVDAIGNLSYDPKRKVGAIIVDDDADILSSGFNGFPRGIVDDQIVLDDQPAKLSMMIHAEQNAIYNAARVGVSVKNSIMMCNLFPCPDCAKAIIQAGIKTLHVPNPYDLDKESKWFKGALLSMNLFKEAGVIVYIRFNDGTREG